MALEAAESFRNKLSVSEDFESVASLEKLRITDSSEFVRALSFVPELGYVEDFDNKSFYLEPGDVTNVFTVGEQDNIKGYAVFKLTEKIPPKETEIRENLARYRLMLASKRRQSLILEWLADRKNETPITINPEIAVQE